MWPQEVASILDATSRFAPAPTFMDYINLVILAGTVADASMPARPRRFVLAGLQTPFTADFGPYRTEVASEPETDSDSDPITDFW